MAEKATIARPYAKAAFEYAREHNSFERWSQVLAIGAAVVSDERAAHLLTNPRVTPEDLVALIADVCGGALDEHGRNFLLTLATNRRLALLPNIAEIFEKLRAEVENVLDVELVSAVQLDDAQRQRMSDALKKRFKRDIRLHCSIDPSLIGGAIVRAGDFVIDGSVKARLERLAGAVTH
ncbi:MAG TPA: F0F1 ATP synthase subunit delta [Steroidobacteraceae bacterium]|nr:F0F1 ATP synthase subunit delta [Steroidobacteraceae bacterium]